MTPLAFLFGISIGWLICYTTVYLSLEKESRKLIEAQDKVINATKIAQNEITKNIEDFRGRWSYAIKELEAYKERYGELKKD